MKTYLVVTMLLGFSAGLAAQPAVDAAQRRPTDSPALSQEETNKALILRYYDEVWHKDNFDFADEIFVADYIRHDPGALVNEQQSQQPRPSELARQLKQSADTRFTFDVVLAEGDLVAVRWTNRITWMGFPNVLRAIVGKRGPVDTTGVNIFRVRNGKIVEIWNNRDDLTTWGEFGLFRWYVIGGFVAGALATLLGGWLLRRRRSHGKPGIPSTAVETA